MENENKQAQVEETATETAAPEKEPKKKADKKAKAELEALKKQVEELTAALEEEKKNHLYLAAEYDNFRRRTKKEMEGIYGDAYLDALKTMLPLFDNMSRMQEYSESGNVKDGLMMLSRQSDEVLARLNIERFGAAGETFDPNIHNAIMHEDDETRGEGEITAVYQVGYRRGEKILRCAVVKVVN